MLLVAHYAGGCYSSLSLVFKPSSSVLQQWDFCMTVNKKSLGSLTFPAKLESESQLEQREGKQREEKL